MARFSVQHGRWSLAALAGVWVVTAVVLGGNPEPAANRNGAAAPSGGPNADAPPAWSAESVDKAARTLPRLYSLLISRRGELIFERYYGGARRDRPANIKSASKSVISALIGIAVDRGLVPGVKAPIVTYFPELGRDPDARKREITVEHLLTMRPGLEGTSNRNYGAWVTSRHWVRHALARPMFAAPGEEMEYSTGNTHLLSAILTKATGKSTLRFANEVLAKPLGFTLAPWPRDPQGIYFGGNDMLMTPRQMLAFGELYLNEGRLNGQQVVSERWVRQSCEGRARDRRPGNPAFDPNGGVDPMRDRRYGYLWWVHEIGDYETCFAWGYGGQYVFILPELDLVLVTTSSPDVSDERRGHRRVVFDILERLVVAPVAGERLSARRVSEEPATD
ncbi:MAG: serine hydrolase [Acidobacteria bacterium]|nr:serine hydrolase [Acidobacteriota bacterium]